MKEKIKAVLVFVLLFAVMAVAMNYVMKVADECWENRAKAAGYYDTLPDSMKNPKDIKK